MFTKKNFLSRTRIILDLKIQFLYLILSKNIEDYIISFEINVVNTNNNLVLFNIIIILKYYFYIYIFLCDLLEILFKYIKCCIRFILIFFDIS